MPPSNRRTPLRRIARGVAMLLAFGIAIVAVLLLHAHLQIRGIDPELPSLEAVRAQADLAGLPIRVSTWNTASQGMPRKQVLEAGLDPDPQAPYVMSHAAFLLEWADGRALLVDAGMDREQARSFDVPSSGSAASRSCRTGESPSASLPLLRGARSRSSSRTCTPITSGASSRCVAPCRAAHARCCSRRRRRWIW